MKIAIAAMLCEGNSLTPVKTRFKDFDYAEGVDMFEKIAITDDLKAKNCEIVPTIYAHALPGGAVVKEDFLMLVEKIVEKMDSSLDGIWLYLHGAMCVEELGSAEEYLLKKIREKVGMSIPISVALDFHADNSDTFVSLCNCITGYRTAPHRDREETEKRALELLFYCIENKILPTPVIERANVIICGDAVQTDLEPMKSIMLMASLLEKTDGMLSVQVFNGQPWIDEEYTGPNFVVTHENNTTFARECAKKLARKFYDLRYDFEFLTEAVEPKEAIKLAMEAKESTVFVSDSGDNTTAGAAGDNAYMLNLLKEMGAKNALVAGIMDSAACDVCYNANIGDTVTVTVGGSLSDTAQSATITGKLIHKGDILSYQYNNAGESATIDCGDITVVITKNRAALCRPDIFESINLDYNKYKIVVVKLGYLFPELAAEAQRAILAFTPGASTERLEDMGLKRIRRPMYPLDDNFLN